VPTEATGNTFDACTDAPGGDSDPFDCLVPDSIVATALDGISVRTKRSGREGSLITFKESGKP
jgi:hypothetical protein